MANNQLTAQERAAIFAALTRETVQMMGSQKATGGSQTISFTLPKARLLAAVSLAVEAKVKVTGAANVAAPGVFAPYRILRRVALSMNNGFSPFIVSGEELALYSSMRTNPRVVENGGAYCGMSAASGSPTAGQYAANTSGIVNTLKFNVDLPVTLNPRDPTGLILLQNEGTTVDVVCDIANGGELVGNKSGYTVEVQEVKITPAVQTFTLPNHPDGYPDLTVLKLVDAQTVSYDANTLCQVKLTAGNIYRKIGLFFRSEADGVVTPLNDFTGNFEIVFNQADIPYSISADALRYRNAQQYSGALASGVYAFDFASGQGLPNLAGTRDYIDTERITEFWLRFTPKSAGKLTIVSEKLARLTVNN